LHYLITGPTQATFRVEPVFHTVDLHHKWELGKPKVEPISSCLFNVGMIEFVCVPVLGGYPLWWVIIVKSSSVSKDLNQNPGRTRPTKVAGNGHRARNLPSGFYLGKGRTKLDRSVLVFKYPDLKGQFYIGFDIELNSIFFRILVPVFVRAQGLGF